MTLKGATFNLTFVDKEASQMPDFGIIYKSSIIDNPTDPIEGNGDGLINFSIIGDNPVIEVTDGDANIKTPELVTDSFYGMNTFPACYLEFVSGTTKDSTATLTITCGENSISLTVKKGGLG